MVRNTQWSQQTTFYTVSCLVPGLSPRAWLVLVRPLSLILIHDHDKMAEKIIYYFHYSPYNLNTQCVCNFSIGVYKTFLKKNASNQGFSDSAGLLFFKPKPLWEIWAFPKCFNFSKMLLYLLIWTNFEDLISSEKSRVLCYEKLAFLKGTHNSLWENGLQVCLTSWWHLGERTVYLLKSAQWFRTLTFWSPFFFPAELNQFFLIISVLQTI